MPIHTRIPITSLRVAWLIPLLILLGMRVPLLAQCALSCNDGLQVSLDQSGQALITTQLIAPNAGGSCPGPLTISLFNDFGQPIANPLTCAQIGQTITARVRHNTSGNFCSGTLEVLDALPPALSGCGEKYIFCNEDPAPEVLGLPLATDNCTASENIEFNYFDDESSFGCGTYQSGIPVLKRIDRHWTANDAYGNTSTCLQTIWIKHITAFNVTFPPNLDNIAAPALTCGQNPSDLSLTGQPTANGVPVGASPECEIASTFTDQSINHCGSGGYTVLRNWTIVDFCTGAINNRTQIIKVEDTEAPILTAPDDFTVGTDGFTCGGTVSLPQAVVSDLCSSVSVLPSWQYGSGFGPFSGIPEGQYPITYTATDACGNTAKTTIQVTVVDNSPPQAICSSDIQISLSSNGVGYINTANADAGSSDNCGPVFLSISRDEIEFMPQIEVTCADQGAPIQITLRVLDISGLENFCQMEVTVRDFLKPLVQCPPSKTLTCLQDYNDLGLTGQATASDNCALQSLIHQDVVNIQPCNIGSITRWWIATDSAANTRSCSQQITVNVLNSTTVAFPSNVSVNGCGTPESILPISTGSPILSGQSCSPLSINYTDQIFSIAPPSCFRIFRAWKVVDHCIYDPNGGSAGIWEHTQVIDVVDHTPPILSIPSDITVGVDPSNCLGLVNLPDATAADCSTQISFSHDSNFSGAGGTNNASGQYPLGVHRVTFTVEDGCGNSTQQTLTITVKDLSPPNAVCLTGVSVQVPASGSITLDPNNFDGGCSDWCSPQNSILFSISPLTMDCQQLGLQPVTLTIQDTAGNIASCNTQVLVLDPDHICGEGGGIGRQIEGHIRTETGLLVHNIPLSLSSDGFFEVTNTDTVGYYSFVDVPSDESYLLTPHNNANWLNGLTTYDLVLISKHIIGTNPLNSPFKMLAADANRSGSITTFDIVQFRKVILGILDTLPNNTSWRFVDSSFVFPDTLNPFSTPVPDYIVFNPLISNQSNQNFIGLKVGDVNESTNPATARAPQDTVYLSFSDREITSGETLAVPVFLEHWSSLEGLQFELTLDPKLVALDHVDFAHPELLGPTHIALKSDGMLAVSWENGNPTGPEFSSKLFNLHLKAKAGTQLSSALRICDTRLSPEAYPVGMDQRSAIALQIAPSIPRKDSDLEVYPNPASDRFYIKNPFDRAAQISLQITDAVGQIIWNQEGVFPEIIELQSRPSTVAQWYFITLKSEYQTVIGKVLIVP